MVPVGAWHAELGHSREQSKADAPVHGFQSAVEGFQAYGIHGKSNY